MSRPMTDPKRRVRAIFRLVDRWARSVDEEESVLHMLRWIWSTWKLSAMLEKAMKAIPREERLRMARNDSDPWLWHAFTERMLSREWKKLKVLDEGLEDPETNSIDWISFMWQALWTRHEIRSLERTLNEMRR